MATEPIGVVLFNLGGPGDLSEVEPFLIKLFSDREIIELPGGAALQPLMARIIAKMRGPSVRENYSRIGGGSPQLRLTREQGVALEHRLNGLAGGNQRFRVVIAMRYSAPTCADALGEMAAADIRRLVTLTLFPQYSKATTGSSRREFDRALGKAVWGRRFEVTHIDRYATDPRYVDAMAETVARAWIRIPAERRTRAVMLFSAHGLPQKFIDEGDPYVDEIEATRAGILARLNFNGHNVLAYQSRTGPVKWIGPGTEEVLESLGLAGVRDVLVVPLSFVSDHIETLYEVDMLFAETAKAAGITGYWRTDALNTSPLFIDALSGLVTDHLSRAEPSCGGCGDCRAKVAV